MGAKIGPISEKGGKKGVQKSMRKIDAEKRRPKCSNQSPLGLRRVGFEPAGGLGGPEKPDLIQISFKTPCTRRGAADVF